MVINPKELLSVHRIKWFLGRIDLTVDEDAGGHIQDAYGAVSEAIKLLESC